MSGIEEISFPATVYRSGGSLVVTIPKRQAELLGLKPGVNVFVTIKLIKKKG